MATILLFRHTDYTLHKRVERACQEHERDMMRRAAWMYQFEGNEPGPCESEEDWESYLNGDYEL